MKRECRDVQEELISLAEGKAASEAQAHVDECPSCAAQLAQYKQIFAAALPLFNAPNDVVMRAQSLMPAVTVRRRFGLLATSFGTAGARRVSEDFQLVVGEEHQSIRLMFIRLPDGWEVMGRTPSPDWRLHRAGTQLAVDSEGRFRFLAQDLSTTAFVVTSPDAEIEIPSAEELLQE